MGSIDIVDWLDCVYIQVGFAQTAALQGTLQRKVLVRIFLLLIFFYVFWYFWIRFFVCFGRCFRQGGYPQMLPGVPKWALAALAVGKCVFSSIFKWFWGPFRNPWGSQVLTFSTLIFIVVSGTVQDGLITRFYRCQLHFRRRFATFFEPLGR